MKLTAPLTLAAALSISVQSAAFGQNQDRNQNQEERNRQQQEDQETATTRSPDSVAGPSVLARMTNILESDIVDRTGKKIGTVDSLIIDATLGQVAYALISFDDREPGKTQFAVPWRAVLPDRGGQILLLQTDMRYFDERNRFPKNDPPDFADQEWGATVHRRFDVEPYWEVHQYFDTTHSTLGSGGWGFRSSFDQLYDEGRMTELSGSVERIVTVRPMPGMSPGTALIVKTSGGEQTVHLAPTWFINRRDLKIAVGDEVTVKAAEATLAGETIFIASSVKSGRETLQLRDEETGESAWTAWRAEHNPELDPAQIERRHAEWESDRSTIVSVTADEFLGLTAANGSGKRLGEVADAVFERNSGEIAYLVIGTEGQRLTPVPWFSTRVDKIERKLVLAVSEENFAAAPSFNASNWPNLNDAEFIRSIHEPFDIHRSVPMYRPARAVIEGGDAGGAQMAFVRKGTEDKTYTGRVVEITREQPIEDMDDAIFLYLQGEIGRQRVYLGPAWWVSQQNFIIRRGDTVTVTGKMWKEGIFTNVIAESIEVGGERVVLIENAEPRWKTDADRASRQAEAEDREDGDGNRSDDDDDGGRDDDDNDDDDDRS